MRLTRAGTSFLDIFSAARAVPPGATQFTPAQVEQIMRTARRAPEVMVKVTGGGIRRAGVMAHLSYISRKGQLEIETDEGERVDKKAQQALLGDWHRSAGRKGISHGRTERHPAHGSHLVSRTWRAGCRSRRLHGTQS
jgi:hypothetical protein